MCWALFLETTHSKKNTQPVCFPCPFGGNVVGIETAAWRYFGRSASDLSWAESATLAVLPNSPALIHPGRNRKQLKTKTRQTPAHAERKKYHRQYRIRIILHGTPAGSPGTLTQRSSSSAGTAGRRHTRNTYHLIGTVFFAKTNPGTRQPLCREYSSSNHIHNLAALIADVETGEILAYRECHFPGR